MNENVKIFALGGMDENGKSLYVVDYNSSLYIFDAGLRYPEESLLGVDVILPGFQYLISHKDRIRGFFLTHGHDENRVRPDVQARVQRHQQRRPVHDGRPPLRKRRQFEDPCGRQSRRHALPDHHAGHRLRHCLHSEHSDVRL